MITSPLANVFSARLDIPPPPECLANPAAMREWLQKSAVTMKATGAIFGYTIGTIDAASPEDRDKPRFSYDSTDRYLGLAVWSADRQGWTVGGNIGELKTLVRFGASVAADLAARPLAGWVLADGTAVGVPDLRASAAHFTGTAPDWGVYTVAYTG